MSGSVELSYEQVLRDPLSLLRQGGLGFVGTDIPIELLLASGRPFGHLPWQPDAETPGADHWLESGFPGWARSILEQWLAGAFEGLHAVVFSRADDAAQRLYYYVRELTARGLLHGPAVHMLDLALIPRASSAAHSAAAIDSLADDLDIDAGAWPSAIARADALRERLAALTAQRGAQGAASERLLRAALWSDPTRWIDTAQVPQIETPCRVLLGGSMPPDERLHRAVDAAGASIVDEVHSAGAARLGPSLGNSAGAAPAMRIATHLQRHASGPRAFIDRAAQLQARAQAARADAAILWLTREDEALAWQLPAQKRALEQAGIPLLVLSAARWNADDGALPAIAAFCAGVCQ
jgi:hypothetical protein